MTTKFRKGTDLVIHLTLNGGVLHDTFSDIKTLKVFVTQIKSCCKQTHTHQPTKTSTNTCCCSNIPQGNPIELKTLITSYDSNTVTADALFPADMQRISGVYYLLARWTEETENLIASDEEFKYVINIDDNTFELVNDTKDVDSLSNEMNIEYTFDNTSV